MAMRIRSMSAGRAGASVYNANVNGEQGGGNKLQGLAPTTNKRVNFILPAIKRRATATREQRSRVFCINQLGGVGRPSKMFATGADGVNKTACLKNSFHGVLNAIYKLFLRRNIDSSGLKTYSAILSGKIPANTVVAYQNYISNGFTDKEARILIVVLSVYYSPEGQQVNGTDPSPAVLAGLMEFYKKYTPIAWSKGLFEFGE